MNDRPARFHIAPADGFFRFITSNLVSSVLGGLSSPFAPTLRALALCAFGTATLMTGSGAVHAGQDAFLTSRMAVSSPAGAVDLCQRYPFACMRSAAAVRVSGGQLDYAVKLNRQINRQVKSISDQAQYGRPEHWALPTARGGDCEDFALIKKMKLIEICPKVGDGPHQAAF